MSPAEMGCLLSHRKVWQLVVDRPDEWAFVAEDDVHLSADASKFFGDDTWVPAGAEIVRAETDQRICELSYEILGEPLGHQLRRVKSKQLGSAGYFVSRAAASKLLKHTEHCIEPVDVVLFGSVAGLLDELVVLQLLPALCLQDMWAQEATRGGALVSQISAERVDFHRSDARSARRRGVAKVVHEVTRVGSQLVAPARRALLGIFGVSVFQRVPINTPSDGMK